MKKYKNSPTMCELRFIRLSLKLLWHNIPLFSFWHYPPCYYPLHRKQRETKRMQVQRKPQSIHVPTALQSRGDLLAENAFTLSHATFVATMCTRRIVSCISESSTQTVCKYIQGHCGNFNICKIELWRKMHFQITVNKIKNVSLCPCLFRRK